MGGGHMILKVVVHVVVVVVVVVMVVVYSRNPSIKFGQKRVSNSRDIFDIEFVWVVAVLLLLLF